MPKILIAASIYPPDPGGPAIHAEAQYKWFREQGYQTDLVALSHYMSWPRWVRHLLYAFRIFIKSFRSNIIYAHDAWGVGFIALIGARLTGQKIVIRLGGDVPWEYEADKGKTPLSMMEWYRAGLHKKNKYYKLSRFVLSRIDALVVTSPLLKDLYGTYYGVNQNLINVIPNPIPVAETGATPVVERFIIFASRLVAYKNLSLVLYALRDVFPQHKDTLFFIMGSGPERSNLEHVSKKLGIESQVIFLGPVPNAEVIERTKKALFTIAPALTEFNPNYVLQGIAFGKPFLTSRENGFPFAIPESLIFDPRSKEDIKKKIEYLLTETGYEEAQENIKNMNFKMSWEDNLTANCNLIQTLLEGHK